MIPKFRLFIKDTQFMDYDVVGIDLKRRYAIVDTGWDIEEIRRFKDIILMQSTGLHDKNGKEIYEGDILKYYDIYFEVVYHNESFGWFEGDDYVPFIDMARSEFVNFEIIGNVHEHPHLLEDNDD